MEARWQLPSSAPLHPDFLLEFAEELWFWSSVIPFPSISFPCFSNSYPDTSTLLSQLMFSTTLHHSHPPPLSYSPSPSSPSGSPSPSSSSSSSSGSPLQQPGCPISVDWDFDLYAIPSEYESSGEEEASYHHEGYYTVNLAGTSYGKMKDQIYCPPAHSDKDTEHIVVDGEDLLEEGDCKQELALPASVSFNPEAVDGLYDVGVLLKGQRYRGVEGVTHEFGREDVLDAMLPKEWPKMTDAHSVQVDRKSKDRKGSTNVEACREAADATCGVAYVGKGSPNQDNSLILTTREPAYRQVMQDLACTKQDEIKEQLKYWAHVVASELYKRKQRSDRTRQK